MSHDVADHDHDPHDIDIETIHTGPFWDERYSGREPVWSGQANQRLVEQTAGLAPGHALDIGCGEGGDAIWLAQQGWTVTAVDVSAIVIDKARVLASTVLAPELAARITWSAEDTRSWQPPAASFDLVSMQFVHLPAPLLTQVQARLVAAVRPGGRLLIVNHDVRDLQTSMGRPHLPEMFLTTTELVATLDQACWEVEFAESFPRPFTDPAGDPVTIHDAVVRAVRRPAAQV